MAQGSGSRIQLHQTCWGNVWEWVEDRYGAYPGGSVTDPQGPRFGSTWTFRGGAIWPPSPIVCRASSRADESPRDSGDVLGFRLLRMGE